MKRTGRKPLDATDQTVKVTVAMPSRQLEYLYKQAQLQRVNVAEVIRRTLRDNELNTLK